MASSSEPRRTYHVFLSFRGPDVRDGFLSHLYSALCGRGIETFLDSEKLTKGEQISKELMKAIQESCVAVILFSKNFASSTWCLDEVVEITKCEKTNGLRVVPVFYKVGPEEVRGGNSCGEGGNTYKKAFDKHKEKCEKDSEVVDKWKEALRDVGNLSDKESNIGVMVESTKGILNQSGSLEFKDEAELVESIVNKVMAQLEWTPLHVARYPVGIDSQVKKLKSLLKMESQDAAPDKGLTIGLWAMGGMGKTTLAKALYNSIFKMFHGSAFLEDINDDSKDMACFQEELLYQILKIRAKVTSVSEGTSSIKQKLHAKRVLIILDGVNSECQLENLAGHHRWYGDGSRIIITTRDQGVLKKYGACICEVTALKRIDAIKLFEKYVFGDGSGRIEKCLWKEALEHTQGLPLALKELGSAFNASCHWDSVMNEFVRSSHQRININLKKSYEELDKIKQNIFLDIACFFDGSSRIYVEGVLGSCYHRPAEKVDDLIRRSLIKDENGTLRVHVLIELMAKDIVDQGCHVNPATRSRIWLHGQLADVLSRDEGRNAAVQAMVLDVKDPKEIDIGPNGFANLKMLRFLILINVDTNFQGPICLPDGLGWFEWHQRRASGVKFTSPPKTLAVLAVRKSIFKEGQ